MSQTVLETKTRATRLLSAAARAHEVRGRRLPIEAYRLVETSAQGS